MKKPKDITSRKGDMVHFISNCGHKSKLWVDGYDGASIKEFEQKGAVITRVERPTQYETIYEAPEQILDQKEKEYLEAVIRPFKNKVNYITKDIRGEFLKEMSYISIVYDDEYAIDLPDFKEDTMYKGMELYKEYTLEELGLFKESRYDY